MWFETLSGRRRFDQFGTGTLLAVITLCAVSFAMIKAFGIGVIFSLAATGIVLCMVLLLACHAHRHGTQRAELQSLLGSILMYAMLLALFYAFLVSLRMALHWLIV